MAKTKTTNLSKEKIKLLDYLKNKKLKIEEKHSFSRVLLRKQKPVSLARFKRTLNPSIHM